MTFRIVKHLRRHVVAYVAVFLALGAGSFAAAKKKKVRIPPNSIGSAKLKDKAVKTAKLSNGAVTREKLDVKIPVAESVGNIEYTTDTPTVKSGSSGINGVAEATGGTDGQVCVDTAKTVSAAFGNAVGHPAPPGVFVETTIPAGAVCSATSDLLVTIHDDTGALTKSSFSLLAF